MNLNFDRSVVLGALINNSDGSVTACAEFHSKRVTVPSRNIHYRVTRHLDDSSVIVVDFGPEGQSTNEIVVGVGHEDNIQHINHNPYFKSLPEELFSRQIHA